MLRVGWRAAAAAERGDRGAASRTSAATMSMIRVGSFNADSHSLKNDLGGIALNVLAPKAALQLRGAAGGGGSAAAGVTTTGAPAAMPTTARHTHGSCSSYSLAHARCSTVHDGSCGAARQLPSSPARLQACGGGGGVHPVVQGDAQRGGHALQATEDSPAVIVLVLQGERGRVCQGRRRRAGLGSAYCASWQPISSGGCSLR